MSFFQRAEVKDIVAYLRCCRTRQTILRSCASSTFPGALEIRPSKRCRRFNRTHAAAAARYFAAGSDDLPRVREKLVAFAELLSDVYAQFGNKSFPDVVEYLLEVIGYDAYLMADRKENYEARADIVMEFVGYIREFTNALDETKVDVLTAFLETVALFSATDDVEELNGRVSMMTLHSAKGLEFPFVFLTGMEDGLFPSTQSIYDPEKLEEERRLCYVGITRAKEKLYLSTAKQRMLYGKITPSMSSRFLVELQDALPKRQSPRQSPRQRARRPSRRSASPCMRSRVALTNRNRNLPTGI